MSKHAKPTSETKDQTMNERLEEKLRRLKRGKGIKQTKQSKRKRKENTSSKKYGKQRIKILKKKIKKT